MVNFVLKIAGDLENLAVLQPQGGCNDPNFTYYLKLKCGNCGEAAPKDTCLSLDETVPSPSGKDYCHLVKKCKFCSREATVTMITGKGHPLTQADSESGRLALLMVFDCRNVEPVGFSFGSGWWAESDRLKKIKSEYDNAQLGNITVDMVLGRMRGMIGLLWKTSLLDADERANDLVRNKIHPTSIISGYRPVTGPEAEEIISTAFESSSRD